MKLKALVLIVSAGVLAAAGLFMVAAPGPTRTDGLALRQTLFSQLGEWLGGEVVRQGSVRLEGLLNMTLEAENVEIKGVRRLDTQLHIKLGKLSARMNWFDAAMGRARFSDLTIEDVTIKTGAPEAAGQAKPFDIKPFDMASLTPLLDLSRVSANGNAAPFGRVQVLGARIWLGARSEGSGRQRPYRRLDIADMTISFSSDGSQELAGNATWRKRTFAVRANRGAPGAALAGEALDVAAAADLLSFAAAGELTTGVGGEPQFRGDVKIAAPDVSTAAQWLNTDLPGEFGLRRQPGASSNPFFASGRVTWKKHELAVTHLETTLDEHSLSGALSVRSKPGGRTGVEGTLAFSSFDISALKGGASGAENAAGSSTAPARLSNLLRTIDADLRISVRQLRAGDVSSGVVALTLLAKDGRLSADLADMAVLGGRVRGHFTLDSSQERRRIAVRATGADLDSAQILRIANAPGWLSGSANVNVEAEADGSDWQGLLKSLGGEMDVTFSEGGSVGLDLLGIAMRRANRSTWARRGVMRFDTLRAELAIDQGRIRSKTFELSADGAAVEGRCVVDLPAQSIDWRFSMKPASALDMDGAAQGAGTLAAGEASPRVTIKGPWRNPSIRIGEPGAEIDWPTGARTHLPNATPNG